LLLYLAGDASWAVINYVGPETSPGAVKLLQMNLLTAYALFGRRGCTARFGRSASRPPSGRCA
jgi:hypothetical protein